MSFPENSSISTYLDLWVLNIYKTTYLQPGTFAVEHVVCPPDLVKNMSSSSLSSAAQMLGRASPKMSQVYLRSMCTCRFVWKCWVNIPNEIAIFHRDNDQQNHWVQWGTLFSDTPMWRIARALLFRAGHVLAHVADLRPVVVKLLSSGTKKQTLHRLLSRITV